MYYEEKLIDGIMHYRSDPNAEFKPYSLKQLSQRYDDMRKRKICECPGDNDA